MKKTIKGYFKFGPDGGVTQFLNIPQEGFTEAEVTYEESKTITITEKELLDAIGCAFAFSGYGMPAGPFIDAFTKVLLQEVTAMSNPT